MKRPFITSYLDNNYFFSKQKFGDENIFRYINSLDGQLDNTKLLLSNEIQKRLALISGDCDLSLSKPLSNNIYQMLLGLEMPAVCIYINFENNYFKRESEESYTINIAQAICVGLLSYLQKSGFLIDNFCQKQF